VVAQDRLRARARQRAERFLADLGSEVRQARLRAGLSQEEVGRRVRASGDKVGRVERGTARSLSFTDAYDIGAVLGLDVAARVYPSGAAVRDAAQARHIQELARTVGPPLRCRFDVALPQREGLPRDLRGWDVMLYGYSERTGIEFEARLSDVQATLRRHNLKRRDDPVDQFVLLLADTHHNRRIVREFAELFADLPRIPTADFLKTLKAGRHPPTGLVLLRSASGGASRSVGVTPTGGDTPAGGAERPTG
jgi:transcriptional regulator with XRE-family HTH domain